MLTDLADALRAGGCMVREDPGWRDRGEAMSGVRAVVWHHTANGSVRNLQSGYPSLRLVRSGRPGIPGPLCNLGLDRDGTFITVAAGRANHAGKGSGFGLPKDNANPWTIGVEVESTGIKVGGVADLTPAQITAIARGGAALCRRYRLDAGMNIGHREWAPTRKIDLVGYPGDLAGLRSDVQRLLSGEAPRADIELVSLTTPAPLKRTPDHLPTLARGHIEGSGWIGLLQRILTEARFYSGAIDADFGPGTETAVIGLQRWAGLGVDGVVGMQTWCLGALATKGTLRRGARDMAVVELLQNLLGYRGGDLDGVFGGGTAERVAQVQRWGGLNDDAVVGGGTRAVFARG